MEKLKEIKAALEKSENQLKQIQADMVVDNNNEVYYKCIDACYQMVSNLRQYVYAVEDNLYKVIDNHAAGHLPKILGAEKMKNVLETLGLDGDYDVQKPAIYIRASRQGKGDIDVDLKLNK
jgi:hypothetical protein